jgi:hypothetical protein
MRNPSSSLLPEAAERETNIELLIGVQEPLVPLGMVQYVGTACCLKLFPHPKLIPSAYKSQTEPYLRRTALASLAEDLYLALVVGTFFQKYDPARAAKMLEMDGVAFTPNIRGQVARIRGGH